jgi:hypothetical protein
MIFSRDLRDASRARVTTDQQRSIVALATSRVIGPWLVVQRRERSINIVAGLTKRNIATTTRFARSWTRPFGRDFSRGSFSDRR